ncbi:uncharacterized protein J7T54_007172 [Emericellopsis cladophorae]|uniref:Uncharacterized protein n=1 Tax=Emericellopsis cladophorae TaxID=2686198 RepID=A0A9P9Y8I7_9HYPO|nr:uncharacterized protein J7T54_007172 [Emericellopsis cladophorae]KAI6785529.1 hypothetical protein J7T54_007172 [Emericellopsis cladophorae]
MLPSSTKNMPTEKRATAPNSNVEQDTPKMVVQQQFNQPNQGRRLRVTKQALGQQRVSKHTKSRFALQSAKTGPPSMPQSELHHFKPATSHLNVHNEVEVCDVFAAVLIVMAIVFIGIMLKGWWNKWIGRRGGDVEQAIPMRTRNKSRSREPEAPDNEYYGTYNDLSDY